MQDMCKYKVKNDDFFLKFMLFYLGDEQIQSAENRNFLFSEKINTRDFQKKNYLSLPCCDTYPAGCCWMYKSQSFIRHKNNNEKKFSPKIFFQDAAADRAGKIFRELDIDGNGELDEDEFVKGCMDDTDLMSMLNSGGLATGEGE